MPELHRDRLRVDRPVLEHRPPVDRAGATVRGHRLSAREPGALGPAGARRPHARLPPPRDPCRGRPRRGGSPARRFGRVWTRRSKSDASSTHGSTGTCQLVRALPGGGDPHLALDVALGKAEAEPAHRSLERFRVDHRGGRSRRAAEAAYSRFRREALLLRESRLPLRRAPCPSLPRDLRPPAPLHPGSRRRSSPRSVPTSPAAGRRDIAGLHAAERAERTQRRSRPSSAQPTGRVTDRISLAVRSPAGLTPHGSAGTRPPAAAAPTRSRPAAVAATARWAGATGDRAGSSVRSSSR